MISTKTIALIIAAVVAVGGIGYMLMKPSSTTETPGTTTTQSGYVVTTNVQVTIQDKLDDNKALADVEVSFYSADGILIESTTTDSHGIAKTSTGSYTSDNTIIIVVGTKTNGSYLPMKFTRVVPRAQVEQIPEYLILDAIQYIKTAEEDQTSAAFYRQGSTVTTYSKADGTTFTGTIQFNIDVKDLAFRESVDVSDMSTYENYLVLKINGSGWEGVKYNGISYQGSYKGSSYVLLIIDVNDVLYDLDEDNAVVGGNDGFVSISLTFDLTGLQDTATVTGFFIIGGTMSFVQENGILPGSSDLLFSKTTQLTFTT